MKKKKNKIPVPKYSDQLLDRRWIRKKSSILRRDNCTCTKCHIQNVILQVHHLYYVENSLAWDYPNKALITLCESCHKLWHEQNRLEIRTTVWCKQEKYKPPKKKDVVWYIKKPNKKQSLADLQVGNRRRKKVGGIWVEVNK